MKRYRIEFLMTVHLFKEVEAEDAGDAVDLATEDVDLDDSFGGEVTYAKVEEILGVVPLGEV